MTVKAPFAFARIPRAVWYPDWGDRVSHDVPFKDGWSGTLTISLEAATELLIGGERRKANDQRAGEVWPVQLPDGTYAIPPSSLQGMIRSVLEIACFGKLGPWVEERRFGVRDISGSATGRENYMRRMTELGHAGTEVDPFKPRSKAGWLIKDGDQVKLVKCAMARMHIDDIINSVTQVKQREVRQRLTSRSDAKNRSKAWVSVTGGWKIKISNPIEKPWRHSSGHILYSRCTFGNDLDASLILTGKPNEGIDRNRLKKWDFVFHSPTRENVSGVKSASISDDVFRDFLLIHQPPKGSGQPINPNWDYWEHDFYNGEPIPVFYIEEMDKEGQAKISAIGTAFMFKLAQTNSTHDMLANSKSGGDNEHIRKWSGSSSAEDKTGRLDLPSLIFGAVGGNQGDWFRYSLKRRAAFGWATTAEKTLVKAQNSDNGNSILLGPKPSYVPIYVRQQQQPDGQHRIANRQPYASYTPDTADSNVHRKEPELSGVKIWPAAQDRHRSATFSVSENPPKIGNAVKNKLNALPAGTEFGSVTLHVHNLRAMELGALIWALTLGQAEAIGGESPLRHRIGMGKPFGLGSLKLSITGGNLIPNALPGETLEREAACAQMHSMMIDFVSEMDKICDRLGSWKNGIVSATPANPVKWAETLQVKALQKAATPESDNPEPYMLLGSPTDKGNGTYIGARKVGDFLPPFNDDKGWELLRSGDDTSRPPTQNGAQLDHQNNAPASGRRDTVKGGSAVNQSNFRQEKGCPVVSRDGKRRGEIVQFEHGVVTIQWDDNLEPERGAFNYIITGSPEL